MNMCSAYVLQCGHQHIKMTVSINMLWSSGNGKTHKGWDLCQGDIDQEFLMQPHILLISCAG